MTYLTMNNRCACNKSKKSHVANVDLCDLRRHVGQTRKINKAPNTRIGGAACQWAPYARRRDEHNVPGDIFLGASFRL